MGFALFVAFMITPVVLTYYLGAAVNELRRRRRPRPPTHQCLTCSRGVPDDLEISLVDDAGVDPWDARTSREEQPDHLAEFLADIPAQRDNELPPLPQRVPGAHL